TLFNHSTLTFNLDMADLTVVCPLLIGQSTPSVLSIVCFSAALPLIFGVIQPEGIIIFHLDIETITRRNEKSYGRLFMDPGVMLRHQDAGTKARTSAYRFFAFGVARRCRRHRESRIVGYAQL
ncbi:MAG TPA: hypothetical protein PKE06_27275, partial [Flavilitoribacter sp.]|nr:hypothetical protein [Flavilitoribacter sp.]HMQ90449.1 hypothetical protein [Flavilitoribacter sp.]